MKCERCEDILSEKDPSRIYDPNCFGYLCAKHTCLANTIPPYKGEVCSLPTCRVCKD